MLLTGNHRSRCIKTLSKKLAAVPPLLLLLERINSQISFSLCWCAIQALLCRRRWCLPWCRSGSSAYNKAQKCIERVKVPPTPKKTGFVFVNEKQGRKRENRCSLVDTTQVRTISETHDIKMTFLSSPSSLIATPPPFRL